MKDKLSHEMKEQLRALLAQDLGRADLTSDIVPVKKVRAKIIANEPCTLAGLEEAAYLFGLKAVKCTRKFKDGEKVRANKAVLLLRGQNKSIFNVERTALNVISRMSAVTTACQEAQKIAGKEIKIAITRKTMPGFNLFDNKAAELGGVWTHRINLNSFVLIKDNHLALFPRASDAILEARRVYGNDLPIEVEVDSFKQAFEAMVAEPDILMLDNFSPKEAGKAVKALREKGFSGKIELSGGVSLKNLKRYAKTKADIISMGSLTQSVHSKNFSLEIL
tara:strand:- start:2965 stop:3798 length:834 start_codon:yes stop_codon:yes gene_type:complete